MPEGDPRVVGGADAGNGVLETKRASGAQQELPDTDPCPRRRGLWVEPEG